MENKELRKGQAILELAIFATIILFALSFLVTYGQRFELQQKLKMEAFRKALAKAYQQNSSVTYTLKQDTRLFNLLGGYGQGQQSSFGASASVMWQKGQAGPQAANPSDYTSYAYYEINGTMLGDPTTGLPRFKKQVCGNNDQNCSSPTEVTVPVSVWKEEQQHAEDYAASTTRGEEQLGEGKGKITNTRTGAITNDAVSYTLYTRQDMTKTSPYESKPPVYQDSATYGGLTYKSQLKADANENNRVEYTASGSGSLERQKTWQTEFQKE